MTGFRLAFVTLLHLLAVLCAFVVGAASQFGTPLRFLLIVAPLLLELGAFFCTQEEWE